VKTEAPERIADRIRARRTFAAITAFVNAKAPIIFANVSKGLF
jgi:hypothetical protein